MKLSFKAKEALENGDFTDAHQLYMDAAELESEVAEFYFDKPEIEPTRSVLIRSAAFLNLKAGLIARAQKFIFFGITNIQDFHIKEQLHNALELTVSLKNTNVDQASREFNYINSLRQRSIHYIIEPSLPFFGNAVSLEMISDFSQSYLKSVKSYSTASFRRAFDISGEIDNALQKEINNITNPLITGSAFGSFKFSIANDFIERPGEQKELVKLKANLIIKYHNEIFTNPLQDSDIQSIKEKYSPEEVNGIFRPLTKIKSNNSPYKIGYYDSDNFNKSFAKKIINEQRKKLLPVKEISKEEIGELESIIMHKRSSASGKISAKTILREQLKSYEFDLKTREIDSKDRSPLILNDEIVLNVSFDSEIGFKFSFNDFRIEYSDVEYEKGLTKFYDRFYDRVIELVNNEEKSDVDLKDYSTLKNLVGNLDTLKS